MRSNKPFILFKENSMLLKKSIGFILFVLLFSTANAIDCNAKIDSANANYAKGNYDQAIRQYATVLDQNLESSELYFNLGNAYYKTNQIGLAILNYERAKKLAPNDEDIISNLRLANQKTEDKIEAAPQLFLSEWEKGIIDMTTEKSWSYFCILSFSVSLILIALYILSTNQKLKKLGFFGGIAIGITSVIVFFIAKQKYEHTINIEEAIITSASVTVTGSPSEKGTKLFILHEGTKVVITEEGEEWTEIKIANGNVGWLKSKTISTI